VPGRGRGGLSGFSHFFLPWGGAGEGLACFVSLAAQLVQGEQGRATAEIPGSRVGAGGLAGWGRFCLGMLLHPVPEKGSFSRHWPRKAGPRSLSREGDSPIREWGGLSPMPGREEAPPLPGPCPGRAPAPVWESLPQEGRRQSWVQRGGVWSSRSQPSCSGVATTPACPPLRRAHWVVLPRQPGRPQPTATGLPYLRCCRSRPGLLATMRPALSSPPLWAAPGTRV
jgi:hypothetical protein